MQGKYCRAMEVLPGRLESIRVLPRVGAELSEHCKDSLICISVLSGTVAM